MRKLLKGLLLMVVSAASVAGVAFGIDMLEKSMRYQQEVQEIQQKQSQTLQNPQSQQQPIYREDPTAQGRVQEYKRERISSQEHNRMFNYQETAPRVYQNATEQGYLQKSGVSSGGRYLTGELNSCRGKHSFDLLKPNCCSSSLKGDCKISEANTYIKIQRDICVFVKEECAEKIKVGFVSVCVRKRYFYCCFGSVMDKNTRVQSGFTLTFDNCTLGLDDNQMKSVKYENITHPQFPEMKGVKTFEGDPNKNPLRYMK